MEDAAGRVRDHDTVAVGGCLFSRTPMALVREIVRARRRGLTLARNLIMDDIGGDLFREPRCVINVHSTHHGFETSGGMTPGDEPIGAGFGLAEEARAALAELSG